MSANLLSYLRNWGASLISSNKAFFGAQAMPNRDTPTVISNSASSFTATFDGWIYWVISAPAQASSFTLQMYGQNTQCVFDPDIGGNRTMLVPVRKGETANFIKNNITTINEEYRCLFKLVGGG